MNENIPNSELLTKNRYHFHLILLKNKNLCFSKKQPVLPDDFEFSVLKNSADKHDPKKKTKREKRDTFKGRDYKALLKKAEDRQQRIEKLKEIAPEKAVALEGSIKFDRAVRQATGEKVKDNIQFLKKGIKRKEKMKERTKKKWQNRKQLENKEKAKKQMKRRMNIDKRKDTKKENKIKKARKRGRVVIAS